MLARITPLDLGKVWLTIEPTLREISPPTAVREFSSTDIYYALLDGSMDLWILKDEDEEWKTYLLTYIVSEQFTQTKNLILFGMYAWKPIKEEEYQESLNVIKRYAIAEGVDQIIGFTTSRKILEQMKKLGEVNYQMFFSVEI